MTTSTTAPVVSTGAVPVVPVATATTFLPSGAAAPMAPVGLTGPVMHGATNVIEHQPIIEREVIVEHPVEVRREHHIQPIIHERERQIQPIIQTEVTAERKVIETVRPPPLSPDWPELFNLDQTTTGP
jgi:hypothetical protein